MTDTPMSPAQQLAEVAARSNMHRDYNSRQVDGGFILNGQTRYVDPDTGGVLASVSCEGIAADAAAAAKSYTNFIATGKFA
jgi:hypothetical protein